MLPKVLIVDDSSDVRVMLRHLLEKKFKAEWFEADSGNSSIKRLSEVHFSLIISDLNMPNGSGLVLYEYLENKHIPIPLIFFTAEALENLEKPVLGAVLKAIVPKTRFADLVKEIEKLGVMRMSRYDLN